MKKSKWSSSIFKITAISGFIWRKVLLNSHDSQTKFWLWPNLPYAFITGSLPPITALGSSPASSKTWVSIEEVVVLPWVPQTPIQLVKIRLIAPKSSALSKQGRFALAYSSSSLPFKIALVYITSSTSSVILSLTWPRYTFAPSFSIRLKVSVSLLSEPETL